MISAMFDLFNLLSLFYVFRSLQVAAAAWRERASLRQDPLTTHKKHLAEQASFFIAVPVGVFVHEFGHALAVWGSGGQVETFAYRVFWGYVVPAGQFTETQRWVIALAGTLGSLLFGLAAWLLLRRHAAPALRYFGLRAFRFQTYFSLIYYPVFTLLGFEGDWRMIYDFGATPLWSGLTAVCHAGLLLLFWYGDRIGWFEMPAYATPEAQVHFDALAAEAARRPEDVGVQLQLVETLRRGGALNRARRHLRLVLAEHPHVGLAHLEMAILASTGKAQVPGTAVASAKRALQLGLPNEPGAAYAHQLLGRYHLDVGHLAQAVDHYGQAIDLARRAGAAPLQLAHLHHQRSAAYRQQRLYDLAQRDVQTARGLAVEAGDEAAVAAYDEALAVIEKQAAGKAGYSE